MLVEEMKSLTPTERDFVLALPELYRFEGVRAYKDWKKETVFGNIFERSKASHAFMTAFVMAVHMTRRIDEDKERSLQQDLAKPKPDAGPSES